VEAVRRSLESGVICDAVKQVSALLDNAVAHYLITTARQPGGEDERAGRDALTSSQHIAPESHKSPKHVVAHATVQATEVESRSVQTAAVYPYGSGEPPSISYSAARGHGSPRSERPLSSGAAAHSPGSTESQAHVAPPPPARPLGTTASVAVQVGGLPGGKLDDHGRGVDCATPPLPEETNSRPRQTSFPGSSKPMHGGAASESEHVPVLERFQKHDRHRRSSRRRGANQDRGQTAKSQGRAATAGDLRCEAPSPADPASINWAPPPGGSMNAAYPEPGPYFSASASAYHPYQLAAQPYLDPRSQAIPKFPARRTHSEATIALPDFRHPQYRAWRDARGGLIALQPSPVLDNMPLHMDPLPPPHHLRAPAMMGNHPSRHPWPVAAAPDMHTQSGAQSPESLPASQPWGSPAALALHKLASRRRQAAGAPVQPVMSRPLPAAARFHLAIHGGSSREVATAYGSAQTQYAAVYGHSKNYQKL